MRHARRAIRESLVQTVVRPADWLNRRTYPAWLEVFMQLRAVVTCAGAEYHDSVAALEGSPQACDRNQ